MNPGITIQKCYVIPLPAGESNVSQSYNECTNLTNGTPKLCVTTVFATDFSNRPICWTSFTCLKFLLCSYCLRWNVYLNASVLYGYRLYVCLVIYKLLICIGYIYAFVLKNIKTTKMLRLFFIIEPFLSLRFSHKLVNRCFFPKIRDSVSCTGMKTEVPQKHHKIELNWIEHCVKNCYYKFDGISRILSIAETHCICFRIYALSKKIQWNECIWYGCSVSQR